MAALTLIVALSATAVATAALDQLCSVAGTCGSQAGGGGAPAPLPIPGLDKIPPGKPQTILLVGSDGRASSSADGDIGRRSDTLMLVHLDGNRPTTLMSIPRDTQVTIPGKGGTSHAGKINEAFGDGGPALTYKVVRNLLGIPISHVVVINFEAFQRAVNRLGCLYEDVDRSYFNNVTGPGGYAAIDVKSGYQLLCGGDTLDWVRFRHTDSDLVRGDRQQAFLRAAKNQVAASRLIDNRSELIWIFRHYTQVDIKSTAALVGLLKLMLDASDQPMRSVPFIASDSPQPGNTNLIVTPAAIATMRAAFLRPAPAQRPAAPTTRTRSTRTRRPASRSASQLAPGLIRATDATTYPGLVRASFDLAGRLPVYSPSVRLATGGWNTLDPVRSYSIKASRFGARTWPAFRLTFSAGGGPMVGQYYGVQGTTWKDAPILKGTHHAVQRRGRTLQVFMAGSRPQLVAWQTPRAAYWVSNTLSQSLTTRQLIDIAASLQRVPG